MKLNKERLERLKCNDVALYRLVLRDGDFSECSIDSFVEALSNNTHLKEIILENFESHILTNIINVLPNSITSLTIKFIKQ